MQVDEPISIVPYDFEWPARFEKERQIISAALENNFIDIQHIGSTAITGLAGKPIIDIAVALITYPASSELIEKLQGIGYEYLGEAGVSGRQYLRKRETRSYNLHLLKGASELWNNNLLFRDYLRSNPAVAEKYARHKQQLMSEGINSLLAYSERKAAMITDIMKAIFDGKDKPFT